MRKSRYTDSQILSILKQNEKGVSVPELCREKQLVIELDGRLHIKRQKKGCQKNTLSQ